MKDTFITYRPYKDLSTTECLLISWIISLNDSKQSICFSNNYAATRLIQSPRNISRCITSLKDKGFISTFQSGGDKRFIHLKKRPELLVFNSESCDIGGIDNMITPNSQIDYTPNQNVYQDGTNCPSTQDKLSNNNKEYNKEYNKAVSAETTTDLVLKQTIKKDNKEDEELFTWMFADFNENPIYFDELYDYWLKLPPRDQNDSAAYANNFVKYMNGKNKKPKLYYYLADKKYNWDLIRK